MPDTSAPTLSRWISDGCWRDKKGRHWLTITGASRHGLGDELANWGKSSCRYLVGKNGLARKVRTLRIRPPRVERTADGRLSNLVFIRFERVTVYLEADLQEIANKRAESLEYEKNHKGDRRPYHGEDEDGWATAAQIWKLRGFGETALGYWVNRPSRQRSGQKALRRRDRPNPGRYGVAKITEYCLADLDAILAGREGGRTGSGQGATATKLRQEKQTRAQEALRALLGTGRQPAGEVMNTLTAQFGISRHTARLALQHLRGIVEENPRPGGGILYYWRLPADQTAQAKGPAATMPAAENRSEAAISPKIHLPPVQYPGSPDNPLYVRVVKDAPGEDIVQRVRDAIGQHGRNAKTDSIVAAVQGNRQKVLEVLRQLKDSGEYDGPEGS